MTGLWLKRKALVPVALLWALGLFPAAAGAAPTLPFGEALRLQLSTTPTLLDYELPGHPSRVGVGHVGVVMDGALLWSYEPRVQVLLGVRARLPFAFDLGTEAAALPVFALILKPFGEATTLRFGTLDHRHGFHPALLDEARYNYGRPLEETYNRSLRPEGYRDIQDLAIGAENGGQFIFHTEHIHAEAYLEWQLLETLEHREKFAVGVLAEYRHRWVQAGFQYRLVHYGGQKFTQADPIRRQALDNRRQPTSLALTLNVHPLDLGWLKVSLPAAFVHGRAIQTPGDRERVHYGFEAGAQAKLFEMVTLGYKIWLPKGGQAKDLSEDGEPVYSGPRAHRAQLGLLQKIGPATVSGRLDLIFAKGSDKVQYLTVTTVQLAWEHLLFSDSPLP